jgi:hypothetical protein
MACVDGRSKNPRGGGSKLKFGHSSRFERATDEHAFIDAAQVWRA